MLASREKLTSKNWNGDENEYIYMNIDVSYNLLETDVGKCKTTKFCT